MIVRPQSSRREYPKPAQKRVKSVVASAVQDHAVVVGGGVAGLVAAGLLSKAGLNVTVLEKNDQVAGRMQSEVRAGYRWDTGPSLLLFPRVYRETFAALGGDFDRLVELREVADAAYRVHYADGSHLDLFYDVRKMCEQLDAVEPGGGRAYLKWLASARAALDLGMQNFIERDFEGWLDLLDPSALLPMASQVDLLDMLGQHHWSLGRYFKSDKLRALFSLQDLYVGLTPYTAPGVFSLLAATEITDGVWYPVGGFGKVRDALRSLVESSGVVVRTGVEVTAIETECNQVKAVSCVDGSTYPASVVVCNADVAKALALVRHASAPARAAREAARAYSASVIAYNWSVTRTLPDLRHHNVFLSGNFRESWQRALDSSKLQRRPNFYVHSPRQTDASAAPPGCESIMVLLPVANLQERTAAGLHGDAKLADLIDAGREAVLQAFKDSGIGDIREHIMGENSFVIDPVEWEQRYALTHGAVFGMSHGLDQLALLRPGFRDGQVDGLYFTGASTRPGNGVPLCMISGRLAAARILKDVCVPRA